MADIGSTTKSQIYVGTMIFSIVAAIISVMLLVFMVWGPPESRQYMYVVLTIEFGMLAIIVNSLAQIFMYEKDVRKAAKDVSSNLVVVDTCPDYYTRHVQPNGLATCKNSFVSPGSQDTYEIGRYTGSTYAPTSDSIKISNYNNKTLADVCSDFGTNEPLQGVPWTDLRAKCESFNLI